MVDLDRISVLFAEKGFCFVRGRVWLQASYKQCERRMSKVGKR